MANPTAKTQTATAGATYQLLPVVGPSAGMDLRTSPTLLAPDRARSLVNFTLTEPGALVVRPGFLQFSTSSLGSGRIQGAQRVYLNTALPAANSTIFTVVGFNGSLYLQSDSGGWPTSAATAVLTGLSTNEYSFPFDRDLVAVLDGTTLPKKSTNGTVWTLLGIAPSAVGPTLSSLSTGGLSSGDYEINFTYKDRDLATESNGSSVASTITLTATSGAFKVIVPNSTDAQVEAIVLYARKVSAGETVRRKISSAAQSGGVSSTFIITSTAWTANDEEPSDHTPPPVLSFGVVWKNRWWARSATVTNRLHFTQLFQPQSWPALFYIDIPFPLGDAIQALVPLGDTLMIFGTTRIFVVIGQTSLDFEVRPTIASQDGAFGPRACAVLENGVVHAGGAGVWIFDGATDKLLSFDLDPAWRDLVTGASPASLAKVAMVYHQLTKELRITVPRRFPSGADGEWILDLNRTRTTGQSAWSATDRTIGGYVSFDGPESQTGNRGRLFSWHSTAARLYEESVGTTANSSNMNAQYEGPGLTLGTFRGRWNDVRLEYEPHAGSCAVEALVDGVTMGSQTVTIAGGGAEYGTATYGVDDYGGGFARRQAYVIFPLESDGRTFVLKLVYDGPEQFRLFSYHVGLTPESMPRSLAG